MPIWATSLRRADIGARETPVAAQWSGTGRVHKPRAVLPVNSPTLPIQLTYLARSSALAVGTGNPQGSLVTLVTPVNLGNERTDSYPQPPPWELRTQLILDARIVKTD